MSSIYKHLSKADLKLEREKPVILPAEEFREPGSPFGRLTGIKIAIVVGFLVGLAALLMAMYLIGALAKESLARKNIESAYAAFQTEAETMQQQNQKYRTEMTKMRNDLRGYAAERSRFEKELDRNRIQISNLEKKVKGIEDQNQALSSQLSNAQASFIPEPASAEAGDLLPLAEIGTIPSIPAPEGEGPMMEEPLPVFQESVSFTEDTLPAGERHQVMTVNRKFNFVVINLGLRDNLRMAERLAVERNGEMMGVIEVEKLYDNFAAATIVEERQDAKIEEGDIVRKA